MSVRAAKAFTLMEILIVVVVIGVMAAFAIPSYTKAIDNAQFREAQKNVRLIAASQVVYKARYGQYYGEDMALGARIEMLNFGLGLNIIAPAGVIYVCGDLMGMTFQCLASSAKWEVYQNLPESVLRCLKPGVPVICPNQ